MSKSAHVRSFLFFFLFFFWIGLKGDHSHNVCEAVPKNILIRQPRLRTLCILVAVTDSQVVISLQPGSYAETGPEG